MFREQRKELKNNKMRDIVLLTWKLGSLEIKSVAPFIFALSRFTKVISGDTSRKGSPTETLECWLYFRGMI